MVSVKGPLNLAILGTRGVPPRYGGFETLAAELGRRLVARGHRVTVYCRSAGDTQPLQWHGIERVVLPSIRHKYLETVSHTLLSAMHARRSDYHAVLICNAANAFVIPLLTTAFIGVAINVDGIERKRRKWNLLGKAVYRVGEWMSAWLADRVVADADVISDYYRDHYEIEPAMIPYGAEFPDEPDSDVLQRLGIQPDRYLLYVSRFEPENNPLEVVRAYEKLGDAPPLVLLGAASYAKDLQDELRRHASEKILLPGALYGPDYRTLQRNTLIYIQATEVGGTHPALIEAMGSGGCVLALDTPENREVGGDAVGYFRLRPTESLSGTIREWLDDRVLRETQKRAARQRVAERYSWEAVTDAYERLFYELA